MSDRDPEDAEKKAQRPGVTTIETVCVDDDATPFGTFQSHNQKVVSNRNGIFMVHLRSRNEAYTAQQWRLSRSTDGGRTFETAYEATDATNPPVLETDEGDNIYLVRPDFVDRNAYLYRFRAEDGYSRPAISMIPNGSAGKYCMAYDRERSQLYYFAHNNTFHVVGLDGAVRRSVTLLQKGEDATLQYPHLYLDRDGTLHAAWTTTHYPPPSDPRRYIYRDIHTMQSRDGGETWQTMGGTPLSVPVVADCTGSTDRITPGGEQDLHTWLSSFMSKDGKVHFTYQANFSVPPRERPGGGHPDGKVHSVHPASLTSPIQHYTRYDLDMAKRDRDVYPEFKGERIFVRDSSAFFATRSREPGSPLYCVTADEERITCLASEDNGETWRDYAVSEAAFPPCGQGSRIYAIGGCREVTQDGYILGSFTHRVFDPADSATGKDTRFVRSHIYFIRLKADLSGR